MEAPKVDLELKAMGEVKAALDSLSSDEAARTRVIRWAAEKFGIDLGAVKKKKSETPKSDGEGEDSDEPYGTFAELYTATGSPAGEADRALVACYWFQVVKKQSTFGGQDVNSELKHVGAGLPNVTVVFNRLKDKKPALLMQVSKAGKSQQARKKYKLTAPGVARVDALLETPDGSGE